MKILHISVANKIATYRLTDGTLICGNKDYQAEFTFDAEWDAHPVKTARFIWNGRHFDKEFTGNVCPVPLIKGARFLSVGVYAGDLSTTTAAVVPCAPSILCNDTEAHPEMEQDFASEAKKAADEAKGHAEEATTAATNAKTYAVEAERSAEGARLGSEAVQAALSEFVKEADADNKYASKTFVKYTCDELERKGLDEISKCVKKTDVASSTSLGLVCINKGYGVNIQNGTGALAVQKAGDTEIRGRSTAYKPIVPSTLDYAVKTALIDNKEEWTGEDKQAARGLIDAVGKTDYGSQSKAGLVKTNNSYGIYGNPATGLISIVGATKVQIDGRIGGYMPIVPNMLDYAVKVALTSNKEILTDEDKEAVQEWLGVKQTTFVTLTSTDGKVAVPSEAKQYAQIREIEGAISIYVEVADQAYRNYTRNYPKRIISDTGAVIFEMPADVITRLPDFGIEGNYIFFEDGKAYYKQTQRADYYDNDGENVAEGEELVEQVYDSANIIRLAQEIVTDVSAYITFDGIIDVSGVETLTVEMEHSEDEVRNMVVEGYEYDDGYEYRNGKIKISFEV